MSCGLFAFFFCPRLFSPRQWTRAAPPENIVLLLAQRDHRRTDRLLFSRSTEKTKGLGPLFRRSSPDFSDSDGDKLLAEAINVAAAVCETSASRETIFKQDLRKEAELADPLKLLA